MMIRTTIFLLFSLCLMPAFGQAQDAVVSLDEAVTRTLAENPALQAQGYQMQIQEARTLQAGITPQPQLSVEAENFLGSGSNDMFSGMQTTFSISWILDRGIRQSRVDAASARMPLIESEINIARLDAVAEKLGGYRAARCWLLSVANRKPLCASDENLSMWARNWRKVQEGAAVLTLALDAKGDSVSRDVEQAVFDLKAGFKTAMDDGLKFHHFWPVLFKFIKHVNGWAADNALTGAAAKACHDELMNIDSILGILDPTQMPVPLSDLPAEVQGMVADRQKAREAKDFAQSDALRDTIEKAGFRVEDTAGIPRVFKA